MASPWSGAIWAGVLVLIGLVLDGHLPVTDGTNCVLADASEHGQGASSAA